MRIKNRVAKVASLAAAGVLASVGIAFAVDTQSSTVEIKFFPNSPPLGAALEPGGLSIETATEKNVDPANNRPVPTKRVILDFDNSISFTTQGLAQCRENLENTTTQQAMNRCSPARVGSGGATARIGPTFVEDDIVVRAFNGRPTAAGDAVILLHARSDELNNTTVLKGILKDSPLAGMGRRLDVNNIPPLANGAGSLVQFQTTVKRQFTAGGNTKHYVRAKCDDPDQDLDLRGQFFYDDPNQNPDTNPEDPDITTDSFPC